MFSDSELPLEFTAHGKVYTKVTDGDGHTLMQEGQFIYVSEGEYHLK